MEPFQNRLVAVMNKSIDPGVAMNAIAHISLSMGAILTPDPIHLIDYRDANDNIYHNISKMPYVILQANSNKIRLLREQAVAHNLKQVTFTDTMTVGTWQEQIERSKKTPTDALIFYGIVLFGKSEIVTELTRKFSLWR